MSVYKIALLFIGFFTLSMTNAWSGDALRLFASKKIVEIQKQNKAFIELTTAWKNMIGKKWILSEKTQ